MTSSSTDVTPRDWRSFQPSFIPQTASWKKKERTESFHSIQSVGCFSIMTRQSEWGYDDIVQIHGVPHGLHLDCTEDDWSVISIVKIVCTKERVTLEFSQDARHPSSLQLQGT